MASTPTRRGRDPALKIEWDDAVEDLFESWHRRVAAAELGHRLMADRMRRRHLMLGIPVVILTTLIGTSAFASISRSNSDQIQFLGVDPDLVLAVVGTIGILAAVLSSLQTFLRYATRAEGHRIAALRYESLRRDMATTLALPRAARGQPDRDLGSVRQRMDRYAKESPTIGERQWEKLSDEFGLSTVPPDPSRRARPVVIPEGNDGGR
ncbi:MAG: SLATT domain-containing protein [Actinomycetota bacterium]